MGMMKTVQMTMELELVERVDARANLLGTTRSAFTRDVLRAALERLDERDLEVRHLEGYRRQPVTRDEFDVPEADRAWGDEARTDEWNME